MDGAALVEHRDDLERWAVFADALELAGDPRGPLMSLMVARERTPTLALDDAYRATELQRTELTPESLRTLSARGHPTLMPVWRRGVIHSAGAETSSDVDALASLEFLDHVSLLPDSAETLTGWLTRLPATLPWRRLEITCLRGELELTDLLARLPRLTSLELQLQFNTASWGDAAAVSRVSLRRANDETLAALRRLSSLRELTLTGTRHERLPALVEGHWWSRLERLTLEGPLPADLLTMLRQSTGPRLTTVRVPPEHVVPSTERVRFVEAPDELETAFLVVEGPFDPAPVVALAKLVGLAQFATASATVHLGGRALTVVRFHGAGEVQLVPRTIAAHLAEKDRTRRLAAITLSRSNDAVSSWSIGPYLAAAGKRSGVRRRDEAFFRHHQLVRETLEAMLGFDSGPSTLESLLEPLGDALLTAVLGTLEPAPALFTDATAIPPEDEEDEDQDEFDDEDDDSGEYDDGSWAINEWGEAPEPAPEPVMVALEVPASAADDEPVLVESDEEEDDERTFDAFDADEAEVWTEGPVELHEDWVDLPGDDLLNAEAGEQELVATDVDGQSTSCARCQAFAVVRRCESCTDEVCLACVPESNREAFEEERSFLCLNCLPG